MAFAKRNEFLSIIPIFDSGTGAVTDAQAYMHVTVTENGVDTQLTYVASMSVLAALTNAEKTQLANIITKIKAASLTVDVPIPLVN